MSENRITFFAVDNGDSSLLEAHGVTVITDIKYRAACTDDDEEKINDFAPVIRKACNNDRVDVFVLTHPDEDHLLGFGEIFHLGPPGDRDPDPDEGDVKIIVDEIWCSEYAANPNYTTDTSKPVLDEITRRKKLAEAPGGQKAGNRLRILTTSNATEETLASGLNWRLLAPTAAEAAIPKAPDGQAQNSANPSSLVIQWQITVGGKASKVLLGGDSTVEVWERIKREYIEDQIDWHILLAPHHCSRHSMGRKIFKNGEEEFEWSSEALEGLDHPLGMSPRVVSSSSKFNHSTPPNPKAREKYYKFLAMGEAVDDGVRNRFLVTAGKKGEDAKDIVFKFTSNGPTYATAGIVSAGAIISPASSGGGGYGNF